MKKIVKIQSDYTPSQLRNIPVGKGYRKINPDEILLPTDERYMLCSSMETPPVMKWHPTHCAGSTMREANTPPSQPLPVSTYRRKLPANYIPRPVERVKPGKGYRLLHPAEILQEGDEWVCAFDIWHPVSPGRIGKSANDMVSSFNRKTRSCNSSPYYVAHRRKVS